MLGKEREKLFTNVGGNVIAKRRVEPNDIASSFILVFIVFSSDVALLRTRLLGYAYTIKTRINEDAISLGSTLRLAITFIEHFLKQRRSIY